MASKLLLAIDGGRTSPGFCEVDLEAPTWPKAFKSAGLVHPGGQYWAAAAEGHWVDPKKPRATYISMCFAAGFLLGRTAAEHYLYVPPSDWRDALYLHGGAAGKEAIQARVLRDLVEPYGYQAYLPKAKGPRGDVLDAIGLAAGLWHMHQLGKDIVRAFPYEGAGIDGCKRPSQALIKAGRARKGKPRARRS